MHPIYLVFTQGFNPIFAKAFDLKTSAIAFIEALHQKNPKFGSKCAAFQIRNDTVLGSNVECYYGGFFLKTTELSS